MTDSSRPCGGQNVSLRYETKQDSGLRYGIIEVTTRCQLACPGCYMVRRDALNNGEMTLEEALHVLDLCKQYRDGYELETMDILGGEPLLWPHLKSYIEELICREIQPWIFTNMVAITPELAGWLFERQVHITGKLNIDPVDETQVSLQADMLGRSDHPELARKMITAIDIFCDAGYGDPLFRLQNLIRKANIGFVPGYYRWCLKRGVGTDIELMGSGEGVDEEYWRVAPTPQQIALMIRQVQAVRSEFGLGKAEVLMPHVFGSCPFYDKGLYFAINGDIRACTNSTVVLSHMSDSDPIKRAYESDLICTRKCLSQEKMGEPCGSCDRWDKCRGGCRATVEGMGDSFGGYTLCPVPYLKETSSQYKPLSWSGHSMHHSHGGGGGHG